MFIMKMENGEIEYIILEKLSRMESSKKGQFSKVSKKNPNKRK